MNVVDLIERKRDGESLTDEEIHWLIKGYVSGSVADYQMAAMAMAVFIRGLGSDELATWTSAMMHSGEVLDFSHMAAPKVDKHSTGGVGDKVSIPLAPMVAACGITVPMMSGRGLGHTGGTLDKLESIPGFRTQLTQAEFTSIVESHGLVLAGQSDTLVPADRKLYALRDATGSVPSIPLIASSVMSKKLAEGLDALVLDVKVGVGAFMQDIDSARELAKTLVGIGANHGVETIAFLTGMDTPLGREVGNASEIRESLSVLRGDGPDDLVEVTMTLGSEMLRAGGVANDDADARSQLRNAVESGRALELFAEVITAQGGDASVIDNESILDRADKTHAVTAETTGVVTRAHARKIGLAAMRLGAGRERQEDTIDPGVGITLDAKPGERIKAGQTLATLRYRHPARLQEALRVLEGAFEIGDDVNTAPLIIDRIASSR